ncbi:hypothetical protein B0H17DRAFT_1199620 [Mycena rosella]|uniref:Uncharacterized protein n=1 Tax=Mycena rosella TaxID=1033263 RepID=A0AAD7DNS7_MYCRO|nr:hypothetical protein B0H17DRAFT_1199620 [Mycena rosella]
MASDPENDPRVAQISAGLILPALASAEAVSEDATAAALAELPHFTGAFVNAVRANDFAPLGSALTNLLTKTVVAAHASAVEAFVTHAWQQHQSETLAAETAAKLQDENWDLRDLVSYQCHKLEMLTTARQRADERSARAIEALEELQCELALKRTAEDLESDLPPKTEEHDEHDGPARPTKRLKTERT